MRCLESSESSDVRKRCGPWGPLTGLSSKWKWNAVRPVESGVRRSSTVESVVTLSVASCYVFGVSFAMRYEMVVEERVRTESALR
jgi:hypothetical protein